MPHKVGRVETGKRCVLVLGQDTSGSDHAWPHMCRRMPGIFSVPGLASVGVTFTIGSLKYSVQPPEIRGTKTKCAGPNDARIVEG